MRYPIHIHGFYHPYYGLHVDRLAVELTIPTRAVALHLEKHFAPAIINAEIIYVIKSHQQRPQEIVNAVVIGSEYSGHIDLDLLLHFYKLGIHGYTPARRSQLNGVQLRNGAAEGRRINEAAVETDARAPDDIIANLPGL